MGVPGMLQLNNLGVHVSATAGSGILSKADLRVNSVYGNFQLRATGVFSRASHFFTMQAHSGHHISKKNQLGLQGSNSHSLAWGRSLAPVG